MRWFDWLLFGFCWSLPFWFWAARRWQLRVRVRGCLCVPGTVNGRCPIHGDQFDVDE
jgi:hypothetical protein